MTPEQAILLVIEKFPFSHYTEHGGDTGGGSYLNIANTALRHLKPSSKILDFGCGPCDKTAILQFLGYSCSGYDDLGDDWCNLPGSKEKIQDFAKGCGIDFHIAIDNVFPFEKNFFDMVMLHDVIEHLHDSPRDILNDLLDLVRPEGLLFITVPNAVNIRKRIDVLFGKTNLPPFDSYYWYPGSWRGHIREYVKDDLIQLSEYLNLEVIELRGCDHHHMLQKLPPQVKLAYMLLTRLFTGWKDTWLLIAKKKPGWTSRKKMPDNELFQILGKNNSFLASLEKEP
jgi:SAM-dependent methyltransferase